MNCELAHERIVLAAYGELADEQVQELERHLAICSECGREREQVEAFRQQADAFEVAEPDANLVARARMRLEEALDALPEKSWWERWRGKAGLGLAGLRSVPLAAGVLLVLGVGAGATGGYQMAVLCAARQAMPQKIAQKAPAAAAREIPQAAQGATGSASANVARIAAVLTEPNSRMVEVRFNQPALRTVRGSLDTPEMQRLLTQASLHPVSTEVQDNSVSLLAAECRVRQGCSQPGVRDALMMALRYGQDADVRAKAIEGLEPLVAEDVRVRNAILEALLNDSDPRIRTISINVLEPVEGDTSVREVLYSVSTTDESPQIRNVSRQMLSRMPEIQ